MAKAKSVHSTPRRTASKISAVSHKPDARKGGDDVMALSNEQLGEYFRDLEQPVRDLGAMVEIVMLVWRDDSAMNQNRLHVVLNKLELMTRDFVDDYRARLNGRWAAEHSEAQ